MLKRMAITSLAAAAIFSAATVATAPLAPAAAQVSFTFGSPPPPVYEYVPAPRVGYVWAPGHYVLMYDRYVWRPGYWVVARTGYERHGYWAPWGYRD